MEVLLFWIACVAAWFLWGKLLNQCSHSTERVVVGYYGGKLLMLVSLGGVGWTLYRAGKWLFVA